MVYSLKSGFYKHKDKNYGKWDNLCEADLNQMFYDGDTMPFFPGVPEDQSEQKSFWKWLSSRYHSYNITKEAVNHYVSALVGQDFTFEVKGKAKKEGEEILKKWWAWQKKSAINQSLSHGEPLKDAVRQMLTRDRGDGSGVGYLRLFQPDKYAHFMGKESYKRFALHTPCDGSVSVEKDDACFIEKITHTHGETTWEYKLRNDGKVAMKKQGGDQEQVYDLKSRFPIFPITGRCLIGVDTRQMQMAINYALTMKNVNVEQAGFRERYIANAQPPGEYKEDPNSPSGKKFIPDPDATIKVGAGSTTMLQGNKIGDVNNPADYTDPKVTVIDPVSIQIFSDSVYLDCQLFYYHLALAHLLSAGDGGVSGRSRIAIQKDYGSNLQAYEDTIEGALSNVMECVLLFLDPDKYDDIEITTNLTLSFGLIPEIVEMLIRMIEAGILSKKKAMEILGNPDAQEELKRILQERNQEGEVISNK